MLVACSLVNCTTWEQAEPVHSLLVTMGIERLSQCDPAFLFPLVRRLGFGNQRSQRLPLMAKAWLRNPPRDHNDVLEFPCCGKYASDSWALFVDGLSVWDVHPTDGKLTWYVNRERERCPTRRKSTSAAGSPSPSSATSPCD